MIHADNSESIPTRQSLLSRLRDLGDEESWEDFFNTYWRLIYNTATKSGLSDVEAQEVVQETVITVSKTIGEFRYDPNRGSFKSWLLKQTKWRIADGFRKQPRKGSVALSEAENNDLINSLPDPNGDQIDKIWEDEWEKNLLEAALERVKKRVDPKHFQIFDLYVLRDWSVAKVAQNTGSNRMQIYLIKHRLCGFLRKEIKAVESTLL